MKSRFDELLPFYVNGSLPEADRAWVEDYLREHPRAAGELEWYRSLQARLLADVPAVSSEVGLERAMQRIRAERPAAARVRRTGPSLVERLVDWLRAALPQPVLRPALAGALAVVVMQGVAIVHLVGERNDDAGEIRTLKGSAVADEGPYLKLNFKADAREADIRLLLIQASATLKAGPGQLGDYYVRVPAGKAATIAEMLKSNAIVDSVAVVDALPARE